MQGLNTYVSGPQGAAMPLAREQRLENQLHEIRDYVENFWYNFPDPMEDGETRALFIRQTDLLEMLDEFGIDAHTLRPDA